MTSTRFGEERPHGEKEKSPQEIDRQETVPTPSVGKETKIEAPARGCPDVEDY
ncbi:MAG: hypothetical protein V3T05_02675 [Myxococcota bacterium]